MSLPPTYGEDRTQLLICPSPGAIQFQKGYLGVHGERAAIEGELHIKDSEDDQWDSATITLQTVESNSQQSIELSSSTLVLFSRASCSTSPTSSTAIPSSLPFSIPLTTDTPQCIHTSRSSISHFLVATLHPVDPSAPTLVKSILVHTRRYTSPNRPLLQTQPEIIQRDDPISIKIETPRTIFRIGEPISLYVTIPPPDVNIIAARGLRLRNVMAELVRVVSTGEDQSVTEPEATEPEATGPSGASRTPSLVHNMIMHQATDEKSDEVYTPRHTADTLHITDGFHTTLTRSGSSCRFHASRPIQIRLLLYPQSTIHNFHEEASLSDSERIEDEDVDCTSITQSTLLHTVSFYVAVHITFMLASSHTESITSINIPIVLIPNTSPLPEVDESVTSAYRKKHDRPPARTVRREEADIAVNEAGPSAPTHSGAPPPFEETDAPPPFFASDPTSSVPSRLPTFLEAESDLDGHISSFLPDTLSEGCQPATSITYILIPGEGTDFGFDPNDQYDGISSAFEETTSPPPSMANASLDTDVTEFANLVSQPEHVLEGLSLAQPTPERGYIQSANGSEALPPPPPPPRLDDPSDPPPSIDVEEFRRPPAPTLSREQTPSPSLTSAPRPSLPVTSMPQNTSNASAPPPYLQPAEHLGPEEPVTRPPPYVDVLL